MREQRCRRDDGTLMIHKEKPSRRLSKPQVDGPHYLPELRELLSLWENDIYYGSLRYYKQGSPFGGGNYACIGISAKAEDARHDWREFQQIKNDLLGEEWEAVELYPAESRLIDPSNRFYLWCFPPGVLRALGLPERRRHVEGPVDGGPPQRPFPEA